MKAAVFKGAGLPMQIEEIADPTPGERQLVVQVAYCGICGTDLHSTREGPAMLPCNSVLGHVVGRWCPGRGAEGSWQGDRVCALPLSVAATAGLHLRQAI
jgi:(R,R)-butanediol dehydrogenase/meso-butanediol dehydrogenase/diacetyl reductase